MAELGWDPRTHAPHCSSQGSSWAAPGDCPHTHPGDSWGPQALDPLPIPPRPDPRIPPPQLAFGGDISELILCQNEVDLALKNLHTWMKDEPVAKNTVSPRSRRGQLQGGSAQAQGESRTFSGSLSPCGDATAQAARGPWGGGLWGDARWGLTVRPTSQLTQLDSAFLRQEPFGLGLITAPWNYPLYLIPWCPWWAPSQQVKESLLLPAPCQSPQPHGLTAAHRARKEGHQVAKKAWFPSGPPSPGCVALGPARHLSEP